MEGASIQLFQFAGHQLDVQRKGDDVFVSVKRVCEALGIDDRSQRAKLEEKPWAVGVMSTSTGPDGKSYQMYMLHLDSLPMWLATIDTNRVAPDARPTLITFQTRCAKVLRDHFFGGSALNADALAAAVAAKLGFGRSPKQPSLPSIIKAVKAGIVSVDEAREQLGLPPGEETRAPAPTAKAYAQRNLFDEAPKPSLREQLARWRAAHLDTFAADPRAVMVELGIAPNVEVATSMPTVRSSIIKAMRNLGVEPKAPSKAEEVDAAELAIVASLKSPTTMPDALEALGLENVRANQSRVGRLLRQAGWEVRRVGTYRVRSYHRSRPEVDLEESLNRR